MNNSYILSELSNKLWHTTKMLLDTNDINGFYSVLYLLVLQRSGLIPEDLEQKDNIKEILREEIYKKIDNNSKELMNIHDDFLEILNKRSLYYKFILPLLRKLDKNANDIQFPEIFDDFLYKVQERKGRLGGINILPKEVSQFLSGLVELPNKAEIYNPFAGLASFGVFSGKEEKYFGQEIDAKTSSLALLRLMAYNRFENSVMIQGDSVENWNPQGIKYDLIIANPPFSVRLSNRNIEGEYVRSYEHFCLKKGINDLKSSGILIALVSQSVLFGKGPEIGLRKNLIENDILETIISLPSNILLNTNIHTSVVVLNKNKKHKGYVKFVDATSYVNESKSKIKKFKSEELITLINSKEVSKKQKFVSNNDIVALDYNLIAKRYLTEELKPEKGNQLVELGYLVNQIAKKSKKYDAKGRFVRIRDLSNNSINFEKSFNDVEIRDIPNYGSELPENSLLLALRWKDLKPTFFFSSKKTIFYSYSDIIACRIDESKVDKKYLINELNKEYVDNQREKYSTGSTISSISRKNIFKIKIQLPPIEIQREKVLSIKDDYLRKEEEKLIRLREEIGIDVADQESVLRHQIAGSLKNVRGAFKSVKKIIDEKIGFENNAIFDLKTSESSSLNFGEYLELINRDLNKIHQSILRSRKELDLLDLNITDIDVIKFLRQYTAELNARHDKIYNVKFDFDKESLQESGNKKVFIKGDNDLIRKMFDNLIENAEKHGFNNTISAKNTIDIYLMFSFEEMEIQIDFSNTGSPVLEEFNFEHFIRKGISLGQNSGNGFGGWYINKIMKKHQGKLEFTDETGSEGIGGDLVSTFELYFPIIAV
ncbi:MAG: N-6 DNA methylase [Flavobacteriaceae bacterium]|nr:N-6 DNA methylase [Flavobacteriaceae bacterium]